jgi:hypothetical protein
MQANTPNPPIGVTSHLNYPTMLIANPISDTAFKFLMSDSRIAMFFLETILEEEITQVDFKPQELTYTKPDDSNNLAASLALFRLDFVATIKTATNEHKKVLIEIQKALKASDIDRFRNYLGEHYKKQEEITTAKGKEKVALPLVTIYILGFELKEVNAALTKVNRELTNQVTREKINAKSDFIERLTHDCYIVQVPRIGSKVQSRLEKLLSFFEQNYFLDEDGIVKEYPYPVEDSAIQLIADTLHFIGTDPEQRSWLATEREAYRSFYAAVDGMEKQLQEQTQRLAKIKKEADQERKARLEKEQEADQERKARMEKEAQLLEKEQEADQERKARIEKEQEAEQERKARMEKEALLLEKERQNEQLLRELEELKRRLDNQ